jgi:hypothetical protein
MPPKRLQASQSSPIKKLQANGIPQSNQDGLLAGLIGFIKRLFAGSTPSQPKRTSGHKKRSSNKPSAGRSRSSQGKRPQGNSARGRSGKGRSQNRSRKAKSPANSVKLSA